MMGKILNFVLLLLVYVNAQNDFPKDRGIYYVDKCLNYETYVSLLSKKNGFSKREN